MEPTDAGEHAGSALSYWYTAESKARAQMATAVSLHCFYKRKGESRFVTLPENSFHLRGIFCYFLVFAFITKVSERQRKCVGRDEIQQKFRFRPWLSRLHTCTTSSTGLPRGDSSIWKHLLFSAFMSTWEHGGVASGKAVLQQKKCSKPKACCIKPSLSRSVPLSGQFFLWIPIGQGQVKRLYFYNSKYNSTLMRSWKTGAWGWNITKKSRKGCSSYGKSMVRTIQGGTAQTFTASLFQPVFLNRVTTDLRPLSWCNSVTWYQDLTDKSYQLPMIHATLKWTIS